MPYSNLPIETDPSGGRGVATYIQDQTTQAIDIWFTAPRGDVVTATAATQGEYSVTLEAGHGAVVGYVIESRTADNYVQALIIAVVGDVITVNTPWSRTFPIGTVVALGDPRMDVLGAATPAGAVVYSIDPSALQRIDVTRIIVSIEDTTAMDFTTFGNLAALANGCVLRKLQSDGNFNNLFAWRTNGDLIERAFEHTFQSKVGGGGFGFVAKSTWAGPGNRGVSLRLAGTDDEQLQLVVQDDLRALSKFRCIVQGHVVQ